MIEQLPHSYSPTILANKLKEVIDAVNALTGRVDALAVRVVEAIPQSADSDGS